MSVGEMIITIEAYERLKSEADHHRERAEKHGTAQHRLEQEVIKLRRQVEALERNLGAVTAAKIVIVDPLHSESLERIANMIEGEGGVLDLINETLAHVEPHVEPIPEAPPTRESLMAAGASEAEADATMAEIKLIEAEAGIGARTARGAMCTRTTSGTPCGGFLPIRISDAGRYELGACVRCDTDPQVQLLDPVESEGARVAATAPQTVAELMAIGMSENEAIATVVADRKAIENGDSEI